MSEEREGVADFATFKRKREHPYDCAVNMEQELYAHSDGSLWPIRDWMGIDGEPCGKDDVVFASAGGDDPKKGPWFAIWLSSFGIGPHQDKVMAMLAERGLGTK